MKKLKTALSLVIFIVIAILGVQIISNSKANQKYKKDNAELNHFKHGLFSVEAWKEQLAVIITDEVDKLYLTRKNEKTLQNHLETQLGVLIDKVYERLKKKNFKTAGGTIKQTFIDSVVDIEDIKKGIPDYAKAMMAEIKSPKMEAQLKSMLKARVEQYMKKTFDTLPDDAKDVIVEKYGASDEEAAKTSLEKLIIRNHNVISEQALFMILLAVILFAMEGFSKLPLPPIQYIVLTLTLLMLLAVGITTPMIDMEARISRLGFVLFDHEIVFQDQVLYFQSKSILDVFWVMIRHKEIQMKFVGCLLVSFSLVFPILKMLSSLAYYYDYCRARQYRVIQFFVLKSGKWSIADVLVVAIFMAFIGFNGIVNSQLSNLAEYSQSVDVMTTNGTSLQPGFYLFFAYTVLAMFLAGFLQMRPYECAKK